MSIWSNPAVARPRHGKDDDACRVLRRKTQYLRKIEIQGHERPLFFSTDTEQRLITAATEPLHQHRAHVMPRRTDAIRTALTEIFIELEFHAAFGSGMGRIRSRDISAP